MNRVFKHESHEGCQEVCDSLCELMCRSCSARHHCHPRYEVNHLQLNWCLNSMVVEIHHAVKPNKYEDLAYKPDQ